MHRSTSAVLLTLVLNGCATEVIDEQEIASVERVDQTAETLVKLPPDALKCAIDIHKSKSVSELEALPVHRPTEYYFRGVAAPNQYCDAYGFEVRDVRGKGRIIAEIASGTWVYDWNSTEDKCRRWRTLAIVEAVDDSTGEIVELGRYEGPIAQINSDGFCFDDFRNIEFDPTFLGLRFDRVRMRARSYYLEPDGSQRQAPVFGLLRIDMYPPALNDVMPF